jgi:type I restriction enzyme S subunit
MKRYEKYKETNLMWYPEIPNGWKICKVKHVAKTYAGGTPSTVKTEYWDKGNIPWLPSGKLQNGEISSAEKFITKEGLDRSSTKWIKENTVLVALTGATCANIGYLKFKACANQSVVAIDEFKDKTNSRFLYYIFLNMRKQILTHQTGGAQAGINDGNVKNLYLTLPSLSEQTQIANYLDYKTGLIDSIIAQKEDLIKKLKEQRQAIINEAVTKGLNPDVKLKDSGIEWLGKIPEHWVVCKIKHLVELKSGNFISANEIEPQGKYPVYGGNGLRGFTNKHTHYGSYILIGRQGALCGNINYAHNQFWATEHAVVTTFKTIMNLDYFGELLRSMNLNQYNESAAQPGLAVGKIENLNIPKISIDEQEKIASFIKLRINLTKTLICKNMKQIEKLKEYRQSLISEAVTGKIDVRDWQAPKS